MRKVFIENLPRRNGTQGKINWKNSIGFKISGIYDDMEFEVEIVDYKKEHQYLCIKYKDKEIFEIKTGDFTKCKLGNLLNGVTKDFKIEIGTIFKNDKRNLTIIDREYRKDKNDYEWKWYKYKCNKCGYDEGWITEYNLSKEIGCSCCGSYRKVLVEYINSIVAKEETHWMIPYFQGGYDEAKLYTKNSGQKIRPVCPDCGRVKDKEMRISDIYKRKSIGCICSDGMSYPEKFMFSTLEQLGLDFQTQLNKTTFKWCDKYRYDFHFELNNEGHIIETHGLQHYEEGSQKSVFEHSDETQSNDEIKKELALKNGIKEENYIVVDCRESELEFIKNKILNSKLSELFNISKIDWIKVEDFSLKTLVKTVCELKRDNPNLTAREISKIMNIGKNTAVRYLKKGSEIWEWCSYNPIDERFKGSSKAGKSKGKQLEIYKDGISLGVFESSSELERKSEELFGVKLLRRNIRFVCSGEAPQHKGFAFKYVE